MRSLLLFFNVYVYSIIILIYLINLFSLLKFSIIIRGKGVNYLICVGLTLRRNFGFSWVQPDSRSIIMD